MIEQKCHEWEIKMWTATIDFTKAFDSITHKSFWTAFITCNIEHDYIRLLKKLYRDQKASVLTDEESNTFEIKKGTKQGDPLSSLLFNMVPQKALENDILRWQKKKVWEFNQMITFQQQETTEIRNRIRAAWATFRTSTGRN